MREQLSITMHGMTRPRAVEALREAATRIERGDLDTHLRVEEMGDTAIDAEDLEGEFTRWAGHYAWRAAVAADADAEYERSAIATKRARADAVLAEVRRSDKKPPDSILEALAEVAPEVVRCGDLEVEALRAKRRLAGELEALRGKRDLLVQLDAKRRADMLLDPIARK